MKQKKTKGSRNHLEASPLVMTTVNGANGEVSVVELDVDPNDIHLYFSAHRLLPDDGGAYGAIPPPELIEWAKAVLRTTEPLPAQLLEAIVVLGHCPTPSALIALEEYEESGRTYAGVATVAIQECLDLIMLGVGNSATFAASDLVI